MARRDFPEVPGYLTPTLGSTAVASGATVSTVAGLTLTSPSITTPTMSSPVITGTIKDTGNNAGTNGQVVQSTGTGWQWATPAAPAPSAATPSTAGAVRGHTSNTVFNTAIGLEALLNGTTGGQSNSAFGYQALKTQTSSYYNSAFGQEALFSNTDGSSQSAFGVRALKANTTGIYNSAFGKNSLYFNTTGNKNVSMGYNAGGTTTGSFNTTLGYSAGSSLKTGSNNLILGNGAQASTTSISNTVTLGNASIATLRAQVTSITALSDVRDKQDIESIPVGLDFINKLNPVKFTWNMRDGGKVGIKDTGFIAQELMLAEDEEDLAEYLQLTYRDNPEKLEASAGRLIPIMVKAIKDLSAKVKELEKIINN